MTTTLMKNSIVGDAWIQSLMQMVPVQRVVNEKGELTGDVLSGPVRLSFVNLFELPKPRAGQQGEPKYGCAILWPPMADLSILIEEYYKVAAAVFPEHWNPATNSYYGLHSPFHDQGEKFKYDGYTPGCQYMTVSSKFKPQIVDTRGNPIVDPAKVYAGVWAVVGLKPYAYGKNPPQPKKGPGFGLQSVMILGDDTNLAVPKGADASQMFKGQIAAALPAPIARPDLSRMPAPPPGMPGNGPALYPAAPTIPPGGYSTAPGMPQTISTTYRAAPPPPTPPATPADDDLAFLLS